MEEEKVEEKRPALRRRKFGKRKTKKLKRISSKYRHNLSLESDD
jgi:hypothetical protein